MQVTVVFDTNSRGDLEALRRIFNSPTEDADGPDVSKYEIPEKDEPAPTPVKKTAPAKKAAAKPQKTVKDAVEAAHKAVADDKKYKIAEALKAVGGSKVSELEDSQVEEFLAVLESEDDI